MTFKTFRFVLVFAVTSALSPVVAQADDFVMTDYEGGGVCEAADWANTFEDADGKQNLVRIDNKTSLVDWATQWSGLPMICPPRDVSKYATFIADVKVEKGQPVQDGSNFYFQLLNASDVGYSYWETYVPQAKVPADGRWYRVHLPMNKMVPQSGDGAQMPKDFKTVSGTVCGMTYDDPNDDKFKFKQTRFDNVILSEKPVKEVTVTVSPLEKSQSKKAKPAAAAK